MLIGQRSILARYSGFLGLRLQLTQQLNITESQSERASDSLGTKSNYGAHYRCLNTERIAY